MRTVPNIEWEVAHDLVTPGGTVYFNQPSVGGSGGGRFYYQIEPADYEIVPAMRVATDNISQQDGSIIHPRFRTGLVATMKVSYQVRETATADYTPACGEDLRIMHELLIAALDSITDLTNGTQRLIWTPSADPGISRRMLDQVVVLGWPTPSRDGNETSVEFSIETPFPYAIDLTQIVTPLAGTDIVTNTGNTKFWPVAKVYGPATTFLLTNSNDLDVFGNPKQIDYDSTRPGGIAIGGGDYAEIDFFRGTIFLNGSSSDLTAGLNPLTTDIWRLLVGSNSIIIGGATADLFWNPSYA